eukprot:6959834-Alexandrium_andersonii.AAC.1
MSASLVGSEMCIRDRTIGAHAADWGWVHRPRLFWAKAMQTGPRHEAARSCLLYTSDAADDM